MGEYLSPGVYVEEFDSGAVPMEGVSTSTTGFIGLAEKGPVGGVPVLITNFGDFTRVFGGFLPEKEFGVYRYLAYAVYHYFVNGGSRCYVSRVVPDDAEAAVYQKEGEGLELKITAKNPGAWGNKIKINLSPASKAKTQIIEVIEEEGGPKKYRVKNSADFNVGDVVAFNDGSEIVYNEVSGAEEGVLEFAEEFTVDVVDTGLVPQKLLFTCEMDMEISHGEVVESYDNVSFNSNAANHISNKILKSELVNLQVNIEGEALPPYQLLTGEEQGTSTISLNGGSDGSQDKVDSGTYIGQDKGPGNRTGIEAFIDNGEASIMAVPGLTDPNVQLSLVAHCENLGSRFAILDTPRDSKKVPDVLVHKDIIDSQYCALYHPWVIIFDPLSKNNISAPPSGSVAGVYSRSDQERGVHKAPANEIVRGCVGLDCHYNAGEQSVLNPKGVNLIRAFQGQGIRVWGARTCSSNALWKYINVRRLYIFIEESIKANTSWVVFENNEPALWARVRRTIENFLTDLWRGGALSGNSPAEAFFVDIGRTTMSQDDIDNGRLICVIGVAAVKPAEFVIFRITQKTNE